MKKSSSYKTKGKSLSVSINRKKEKREIKEYMKNEQSTTLQEKEELLIPKFYYPKMHRRNFQIEGHCGTVLRK